MRPDITLSLYGVKVLPIGFFQAVFIQIFIGYLQQLKNQILRVWVIMLFYNKRKLGAIAMMLLHVRQTDRAVYLQ